MSAYGIARDAGRYGFALGKVRVLEARLLSGSTYERLVDAPSFAEQMRVLSDTPYGRYLEGAQTADAVEDGLEVAIDDTYRFLDEAGLPSAVVRFFRVQHDFDNLRAVLKARLLGAPLDHLLSDLGTVSAETVADPESELPPFLSRVVELLSGGDDDGALSADRIDIEVERAMFAEMEVCAREAGTRALKDLAAVAVDVANARVALRALRRNAPRETVAGLLIEGGSIATADLLAAYDLPAIERIGALAALTAGRDIDVAALGDLASLDVTLDNVVVGRLRRARAVPLGSEPVIAYVMAREAEVIAVRMLLIGRLANLSSETLRARLRERYV